MTSIETITDILIFTSGLVLILVAVIFFQLFRRYLRRDYLLLALGSIAAAAQVTVEEIDLILGETQTAETLELISAIFSTIMVGILVFVLAFPDRVPIDFEEKLAGDDHENED